MTVGQRITIGKLAKLTSSNVPTVRYYEEIGLLPPAARTAGGQRAYTEQDLQRMIFIRRCRDFGFPIEQVRELIALAEKPEKDCMEARDVAQMHLDSIRVKLRELQGLEQSLMKFVNSCDAGCAGGRAGDCSILEDLATPGSSCCN